jgi:hypothetical protein
MTTPIRVTCAVPAFNAGDTTRGIEITRAIREIGHQRSSEAEITFIYPRTTQTFEAQIRRAGFSVRPLEYPLTDEEVAAIFHADHTGNEFFPDLDSARQVLHVCITELETNRPDLVLFGFLPPVGIAAQLLRVPAVSFVPFPVYRPWVSRHFLKDLPDELKGTVLGRAPQRLRQKLARGLSWLLTHSRFFTQPTLAAAARELGWSPPRPSLFEMLDADMQLVNDLPAYYEGEDTGSHTRIAGPLFSRPADAPVAPDILRQFEPDDVPRVFVAMGSSGEKQYLLDAIEAVTRVPCRAVVVVPPHVCGLEEARHRAGDSPHVLLTDAFVPAHVVNTMADFAIIHGGQGTIQTAVFSGTPVVGVGMQWEQSTNIDRLVQRGAAIRIARNQWRPATIEQALRQLIASPSFRASARQLKAELDATNGRQLTGELIWDLVSPTVEENM